jgi:hypothetical protein
MRRSAPASISAVLIDGDLMVEDKHMATVKDAAQALRAVKARLSGIYQELDEAQASLPERHWRTGIDDDIGEVAVSLDMAESSIDSALRHLAEITGEDVPEEPSAS